MFSPQVCPTNEQADVTREGKIKALKQLATISLMNGSATEIQKKTAFEMAQRAGVTTWQYLRARLLLEAKVFVECVDDQAREELS